MTITSTFDTQFSVARDSEALVSVIPNQLEGHGLNVTEILDLRRRVLLEDPITSLPQRHIDASMLV